MALSIKNARVEQLAREVAAASGETLTQAVLCARSTPDLVETLLTISNRCGALPDLDSRGADEILGHGPDDG